MWCNHLRHNTNTTSQYNPYRELMMPSSSFTLSVTDYNRQSQLHNQQMPTQADTSGPVSHQLLRNGPTRVPCWQLVVTVAIKCHIPTRVKDSWSCSSKFVSDTSIGKVDGIVHAKWCMGFSWSRNLITWNPPCFDCFLNFKTALNSLSLFGKNVWLRTTSL